MTCETKSTPSAVVMEVRGSERQGLGHVSRSLALAHSIDRSWGVKPVFLTNEHPRVTDWIKRAGFDIDVGLPAEIDTWFIDVPMPDSDRVSRMNRRERAALVVGLDYFHYTPPRPDLIINLLNHGKERPSGGIDYAEGLEFAIIRDEVRRREGLHPIPARVQRLLVVFGGSDAVGSTPQALDLLASLPRQELPNRVDVVLGPLYAGPSNMIASSPVPGLRVYRAPGNLTKLFQEADLSVCNGGTTMLELLHTGVPSIVFPARRAEEQFAAIPEAAGALRLVPRDAPDEARREVLRQMLTSAAEERRSISKAGRALVDGKGASRILSRTLELWREREAQWRND